MSNLEDGKTLMSVSSHGHPFPARPTKIIMAKGTDFEIGVQHAEAVGEHINQGMARFYFDFWNRMIRSVPPGLLRSLAFKTGRWLVDPVLVRRLSSQLPTFLKDRLHGMVEASGGSLNQFTTAIILPDLLPLLEVFAYRFRPSSFIEVMPPPQFGCSSFVSRGDRFLHGRNLDFPGVAYWDRSQVIQVTKPKSGLSYIGFTTAGVPLCGITGVNEAQVSVSLHQHYCKKASLSGEPPFSVGERILNRASSLQEAIEIIKQTRLISSWAFILTDGKRQEALIYECHPGAYGIRPLSSGPSFITHSNYFQTDACRTAEFATCSRMNWDNHARKLRLDELLKSAQETLSIEQAVKFISDQYDPFWQEEKILNRTVSQIYNVQSLVLDSENMVAYLAEGNAPVHSGRYQMYDLAALLDGKTAKSDKYCLGHAFKDPDRTSAKQEYILSFVAAFDGDFVEADRRLHSALTLDFVPEAAYVAGIIKMKLGYLETGCELLSKAKQAIEKKLDVKKREKGNGDSSINKSLIFPPEYFEITLFLARSLDLLGKRKEAQDLNRFIASHPDLQDAHIRRIASQDHVYRKNQLASIMMPYSSYIPFE